MLTFCFCNASLTEDKACGATLRGACASLALLSMLRAQHWRLQCHCASVRAKTDG
jgi:hypothetical protein